MAQEEHHHDTRGGLRRNFDQFAGEASFPVLGLQDRMLPGKQFKTIDRPQGVFSDKK